MKSKKNRTPKKVVKKTLGDVFRAKQKQNTKKLGHFSTEETQARITSAIEKALADADEQGLDSVEIGIASQEGFVSQYGTTYPAPGVTVTRNGLHQEISLGSTQKSLNPSKDDPMGSSKQISDSENDLWGGTEEVIDPPWNFDILQTLLATNTPHASAIDTKASDYAYSGWTLQVTEETEKAIKAGTLNRDTVDEVRAEVERFLIRCANGAPIEDFCRDLAIEYETLGMCGFELIRNKSGLLGGVKHIPFRTLRLLNQNSVPYKNGARYLQVRFDQKRYYTSMGDNVVYKDDDFNPASSPLTDFPEPNDVARKDFVSWASNLVTSGKAESTSNPSDAASELFVLERRPFTLSESYGTPAGVQSLAAMLALRKIQQYNLQFFESKGIPQYAVIIKGLSKQRPGVVRREGAGSSPQRDTDDIAKLTQVISEYFTDRIKRADRSVLVMRMFGQAEVKFERLSSDEVEASFAEYEERMNEEIRMSHRIPPAAIGKNEETANIGSGRDTTQMKRYRDHIVVPGQRQFSHLVNTIIRGGLLVPYFKFVFDPISLDEETDIRKYFLDMYRNGAINIQELRDRAPGEFADIEEDEGDVRMFPPGTVLIGESIEIVSQALTMALQKHERLNQDKEELNKKQEELIQQLEANRGKETKKETIRKWWKK